MGKKILIAIFFLSLANYVYAQQFGFGFNDFPTNFANGIFTSTDDWPPGGTLTASDITVQLALQSLSASGPSVYLKLDTSNDPLTGDLDFSDNNIERVDQVQFDSNMYFDRENNTTLKLYVNSTLIHTWEDTTALSFLLMTTGDKVLTTGGDNIILAQ